MQEVIVTVFQRPGTLIQIQFRIGGHDVDYTARGVAAVHRALGAIEDLDALNVKKP